MVRRYWVLGIECTLLETHKLAWFVERTIKRMGLSNPLELRFKAGRYGPYADRLTHLLDGLDGSYLHCDKRLADAGPFDTIWFDDSKRDKIAAYLNSREARMYAPAIESTDALIDGFQSPLGLEALATVDWLIVCEGAEPTVGGIKAGIRNWPAGEAAALRKERGAGAYPVVRRSLPLQGQQGPPGQARIKALARLPRSKPSSRRR